MPEKLSIEVTKHSDHDIRLIIKTTHRITRVSINNLSLCKGLINEAIDLSCIFEKGMTFEEVLNGLS